MKIEFKNQKLDMDINIHEDYPLMWHTNEKGERVDELTISKAKGHFALEFDGEINFGALKAVSVFDFVRMCHKLYEQRRQKNCKVCKIE